MVEGPCFTLSLGQGDLLKRLLLLLLVVSGGGCGVFGLRGGLLGICLGSRGLILCWGPGLDLPDVLALRTWP